ncbi:MAG: HAD family hydrolase, partial [Chloroflexi bacterium CFX7]|nr:HAD family hydrolase [Chloroflexi bacterium CFX7]
MARVDTIAFDKTGTLTFGRPCLVEVVPMNGVSEAQLLQLAASAEKFSEHPLGRAVAQAALARNLPIPDPDHFIALPGLGVKAWVEGRELQLGRVQLLADQGDAIAPEFPLETITSTVQGRTVIPVTIDQQMAGRLVLEDEIRPEARQTITALHGLGLRTVLISGDNRAVAERIAKELGVGEVYAEVLPHQKVVIIQRLQAEGHMVAFVGDGVNDGPALATADVGVAMGQAGTDVAIETADVALLSDDLTKLPHLLRLSRQAIRAIQQNLIFSLGVLGAAV